MPGDLIWRWQSGSRQKPVPLCQWKAIAVQNLSSAAWSGAGCGSSRISRHQNGWVSSDNLNKSRREEDGQIFEQADPTRHRSKTGQAPLAVHDRHGLTDRNHKQHSRGIAVVINNPFGQHRLPRNGASGSSQSSVYRSARDIVVNRGSLRLIPCCRFQLYWPA